MNWIAILNSCLSYCIGIGFQCPPLISLLICGFVNYRADSFAKCEDGLPRDNEDDTIFLFYSLHTILQILYHTLSTLLLMRWWKVGLLVLVLWTCYRVLCILLCNIFVFTLQIKMPQKVREFNLKYSALLIITLGLTQGHHCAIHCIGLKEMK